MQWFSYLDNREVLLDLYIPLIRDTSIATETMAVAIDMAVIAMDKAAITTDIVLLLHIQWQLIHIWHLSL